MATTANEPRRLEALLLDMDGVLAEVSLSYRQAIVETAKHFGASVTFDDIEQHKLAGNANNDWQLTHRLIHSKKADATATLDQVTQVFEDFYQGIDGRPGLYLLETLLTPRGLLEELNKRLPKGMAIVTGRPRKDCDKFLKMYNVEHLFPVRICMEDGPPKPSSIPVELALARLGVVASAAAMVGDTVDDVVAAVSAQTIAFGVLTPIAHAKAIVQQSDSPLVEVLERAGASSVLLPGLGELLDIIPPLGKDATLSFGSPREATVSRVTKETSIDVKIRLDGTGASQVTALWFDFLSNDFH